MSPLYGTVRVSSDEKTLEIECQPHVAIRLKRWFPRVPQGSVGPLWLSLSDEIARDLQWFLDRYPMEFKPSYGAAVIDRLANSFDERMDLARKILSGEHEVEGLELAIPAREYQAQAAQIALATGGLLVADELGLGKTVTGISMLASRRALPAVVVVQPHLQRQWKRELARFLPQLSVHITKTTAPYPAPDTDVLITTYSKLHGWADYLAGTARSVIFDECQELRRSDSAKYRAAAGIASAANFRMGLSATPIHNYGSEYFNVMDVLRPGALGNWSEFITEHCTFGVGRENWKLRDPEAFGAMLRDQALMVKRTRSEVGRELPALNQVTEYVDADLEHLKSIETAATELAKVILAAGGSGFEKLRASEEFSMRLRQQTGIAKAPYVAAFVRMLIEETSESVVLAGWHREVYRLWLDHLGDLSPAMYTGTESPVKKQKEAERFISGETKLLILSLRSGSGLDGLQAKAHRVVFGELDWSPAVHEQCTGRLYRDGQSEPVFSYYLLANAGSDPVVSDVLGVKRGQQLGVLDPDRPLFIQRTVDPDHVKILARAYLQSKGISPKDVADTEPELVAGEGYSAGMDAELEEVI